MIGFDLPRLGASLPNGFNENLFPSAALFDGGYLSWTPSSLGSTDKATFSAYVKHGADTVGEDYIFSAGTGNSGYTDFIRHYQSKAKIHLAGNNAAAAHKELAQVFRDYASYYHLLVSMDLSQVSASDKIKVYINGALVTDFNTNTNTATAFKFFNTAVRHLLGATSYSDSHNFLGYLAEVHFIDGQVLSPTVFGKFNKSNPNIWEPIKPNISNYGTNGFHLDFSNAANLGEDQSGNGNDWTVNGTITQVQDAPSDNAAVLNPLSFHRPTSVNYSNGNKTQTNNSASSGQNVTAYSFGMVNDTYLEVVFEQNFNVWSSLGIVDGDPQEEFVGWTKAGMSLREDTNIAYYNAGSTVAISGGFTKADGDVFMMAYEASSRKVWVGKNGTWFNAGDPSNRLSELLVLGGNYLPVPTISTAGEPGGNNVVTIKINEDEWTYPAPAGFLALTTANLPKTAYNPDDFFKTSTFLGNASSRSIAGLGFQPDLVWFKNRSVAYNHELYDSVRGVNKALYANLTNAEGTESNGLTSFDDDGFSIGPKLDINGSGNNIVANCFKQGPHFQIAAAVANGLSSQVVPLVDFDNLGIPWEMIIVKNITSGAKNWYVYHKDIGNTKALFLDGTDAAATSIAYWNNTDPTATSLTVGASMSNNNSGDTLIIYAFRSVEGLCDVGSYHGNYSTDGTFLNTNGSPSFFLSKITDSAGLNWAMLDSVRNPHNVINNYLFANTSAVEASTSGLELDFVSNGVKLRGNNSNINANTNKYIYLAMLGGAAGGAKMPPMNGQ
ncbi:MAG: hypothetical protein R3261_01290 [Alphaproteobacteria bacterium]|nr:hypothetical protein [Alphaproteobacteria bacterium]